jgi:hypothetical protein
MKKLIAIFLAFVLLVTFGVVWYNRVEVTASNTIISIKTGLNTLYDIPAATTYGWINGVPVVSEELNFAWVNGKPYGIFTAATSVVSYSLTNSPDNKTFAGYLAPSATYYAKGTPPSTPVVNGDCTFTITNDGSNTEKITIQSTDFTNYALASTADATHVKMVAVYSGLADPANGIVVNGTAQTLVSSLTASSTKMWDFSIGTITANGNGNVQTATITLTAVAP